MKDRSLPEHWITIGNGQMAVRIDGVEIKYNQRYEALLVLSTSGTVLSQRTKGQSRTRPRLFRYLDAAAAAADAMWPFNHEPAFRLVADQQDWRKPINAVVRGDKLAAVIRAVKVMTGCDCIVSVEPDGHFRIKTVGVPNGKPTLQSCEKQSHLGHEPIGDALSTATTAADRAT